MSIAMLVGLAVVAQGRLVTFDNTKARLDTNGAIMNAHDGPTQVQFLVYTHIIALCVI